VIADKNIFCNSPWYGIQIYWDGSLGICCQEDHKLYHHDHDTRYNIANMTILEWFNSEPVRDFRTRILGDQRLSECRRCYAEEDHNGNSRRLRENSKSVIFTRTAFDASFQQSPGYQHFIHSYQSQGFTAKVPVDLHIDLGNFCNLACKMCSPRASSTIAAQHVKWGIADSRQYLGLDWTKNTTVWNNFKQQLLDIPNLNNIHFMGGETLLTDRLENLVDTMIEHQRFDLCFSFVTNGTVLRPRLMDKLKQFRRVGIEVSIETVDEHNQYQRQGTDTAMVLDNISRYLKWCNGSSITVALRPVPSLLSIGYYCGLLEYALEHDMIVKSNLCTYPRFLSAEILPDIVKKQYQKPFEDLLLRLKDIKIDSDYNASDPHNCQRVIKQQAELCLSVLQTPTPIDSEHELEAMVRHCEKWDRVYGYDARKLYPEFEKILNRYEYNVSH